MLTIILIMTLGVFIGWMLRRRNLRGISHVINIFIWLLLFLLGTEVGTDDRIFRGISSLGVEAIAIAVAGVGGSAVLSFLLWKWVQSDKKKRI